MYVSPIYQCVLLVFAKDRPQNLRAIERRDTPQFVFGYTRAVAAGSPGNSQLISVLRDGLAPGQLKPHCWDRTNERRTLVLIFRAGNYTS